MFFEYIINRWLQTRRRLIRSVYTFLFQIINLITCVFHFKNKVLILFIHFLLQGIDSLYTFDSSMSTTLSVIHLKFRFSDCVSVSKLQLTSLVDPAANRRKAVSRSFDPGIPGLPRTPTFGVLQRKAQPVCLHVTFGITVCNK